MYLECVYTLCTRGWVGWRPGCISIEIRFEKLKILSDFGTDFQAILFSIDFGTDFVFGAFSNWLN